MIVLVGKTMKISIECDKMDDFNGRYKKFGKFFEVDGFLVLMYGGRRCCQMFFFFYNMAGMSRLFRACRPSDAEPAVYN